MRIAEPTITVCQASISRVPQSFADQRGSVQLSAATLPLGAPALNHGVLEQFGDGAVTMIDALGDGRAWPFACAGGALGAALGGFELTRAFWSGDTDKIGPACCKLVDGVLGVVAGFGVHPATQGAIEATRLVLGSTLWPTRTR